MKIRVVKQLEDGKFQIKYTHEKKRFKVSKTKEEIEQMEKDGATVNCKYIIRDAK